MVVSAEEDMVLLAQRAFAQEGVVLLVSSGGCGLVGSGGCEMVFLIQEDCFRRV